MPSNTPHIHLAPATYPSDLPTIHHLLTAYAASLDVDISFQSFDTELANLPGAYAPSARGALFLARLSQDGPAIGCIGLRALSPARCELKRLYTRPEARGLGVGAALVERAVAEARRLGFEDVVLDTLARMRVARGLYVRVGFGEMEAYYGNPLRGVVYYRLVLG